MPVIRRLLNRFMIQVFDLLYFGDSPFTTHKSQFYKYGINFFIPLESVFSISLGLLRPRFRLVAFFVRICRANAFLALIFPVPVFLNLLAAPRLVFNFGTWFSPLINSDSVCEQ